MNQKTAQAFIGAWRLISFEINSHDGNTTQPFGTNPIGSIIYTDTGRMSAQVMQGDRPFFADEDQIKGTPEEIEAGFKSCISYFGSYRVNVDDGFVIHQIEGSLFPNWEGSAQKRFFEFSGNRMKLSTPPIRWGGDQATAVLVWERIE